MAAALVEGNPAAEETPFNYGIYLERFCGALTGGPGSGSLRLPALEALELWHNHNAMGPPLVDPGRKVDLRCEAGHGRLRSLGCWNLSHFRRLVLRRMPRLRSEVVSYQQEVPTLEGVEVELGRDLLGRRVSIRSGKRDFH